MEEHTEQEESVEVVAIRKEDIASAILAKRDEAVRARKASGIERQWREDEIAFNGGSSRIGHGVVDYATGVEFPGKNSGPTRSRVEINIVRGKCEVAEGRFCEICLPTEEKNWGLKPTPIPELDDLEQDKRPAYQDNKPVTDKEGNQATIGDIVAHKKELAIQKMEKMEAVIDDQLVECDYNAELRKVIRNAIRLGTGIIKGPNIIKRTHRRWKETESGYEMVITEDIRPYSVSVSPWAIYPDAQCLENNKKPTSVWEHDRISPRSLRELIGLPGYDEEVIREILEEDPVRTAIDVEADSGRNKEKQTAEKGEDYEKWEFHGTLSKDSIEQLGCSCEAVEAINGMFSACVVFVNDRPIKTILNPLDSGELPYDFFRWTEVSDSFWGIGIPRQMFFEQKIMNAAWRAMMDNAADSSGANLVLGDGIVPFDKKYELVGKKLWKYSGGSFDDVKKAVYQFQIESRQEPLQNIMELVLRYSDLETGLPTVFQGEQQKNPETLGATNIMVDSNNVSMRWRVKLFDDDLTDPHITRYYDWNMQYNEDDEIKGDYMVDARGTSVLLERDSQYQAVLQAFQFKNDPHFAKKINWDKAVEQYLKFHRLDIANSDEEVQKIEQQEAQQQQPKAPQVEAAEIRTNAELEKVKLSEQSDQQEIQMKEKVLKMEQDFEARMKQLEFEHKERMRQMDLNIEIMQMAQEKEMSIDEIKAGFAETSVKLQTQKEIAGTNSPQVLTPATEPPGRAENGQAFAR